ncbi:MAG: hypothetical protein F6K39_03450 [Okeania sp. SIO3B3]|nr:hypothetical protein [Okeania sp. SIO3B3]
MFKPENNLSRFKRALLSYTFLVSLIVSIPITIGLGYLVKSNRDIKEYKQSILWYENLNEETKYTKVFSDFVKEVQKQLTENYNSNFNNAINDKDSARYISSIIVEDTASLEKFLVPWQIEKTGEFINVSYSHTRVIDFNNLQDSSSNDIDRNQEKEQSRNDKVFQAFTQLMLKKISNILKQDNVNNNNGIDNLHNFSKVIIDYLTKNKSYSSLIPYLKVNNIYILNVNTGFLISYPASDQAYKRVNFETRPWFRATKNNYHVEFDYEDRYDNTSGITGVYIDINDEKNEPNVIRTLWY